jgi:quercetin dioxygenase-like cupin family protein
MKVPRLYEDADGASHFDEFDVTMSPPPISLSAIQDANGVMFMGASGNQTMAPHRAPHRQFMIVLEGEWECTSTDGETRRFGPGGILLAEDTTGLGHATSTPTADGVLVAAVVLP